ncbi:MAG: hypothetical protein M3Z49_12590 [Bifidobacteriales bacterium]|nr:hypothetical protein [Bifidobacteriales bacterium]
MAGHHGRSTGRVHRIEALPFIANPEPGSRGQSWEYFEVVGEYAGAGMQVPSLMGQAWV